MQFSDEDLIAFLLGDASPELSRAVNQQLAAEEGRVRADGDLASRIADFRKLLGQIDSIGSAYTYEPPSDLVDRTMERIDGCLAANESDAAGDQRNRTTQTPASAGRLLGLAASSCAPSHRSFLDSAALATCLTVVCCLALPALVRVRFESRKSQCAQNLSGLGSEFVDFALISPDRRLPFVALEGPGAFAGVYAVRLRDAGATITPTRLSCGSLLGIERPGNNLPAIPTLAELQQMAIQELELWQRAIGGDYAYNLGVEEGESVRAPRFEGRSHFAIMADAPVIMGQQEQFIAHDGRGINLLYEDGRVAFVSVRAFVVETPFAAQPLLPVSDADDPVSLRQVGAEGILSRSGFVDNPFRNQLGVHEVGLHPHDASLAPSHFPPFGR